MTNKLPLLLITAALIGCNKDQNAPAMSRTDAEQLKNEKAKSEMIQDRPLTINTHFAAGQLAETQGDIPRAIEQYNAVLNVSPKHEAALFRLGLIYSAEQQFPQAISTWNRYIQVTRGSANGYSNLGLTLQMANRFPEAESAFKTGISHDPTNEACRINYGLMLAAQSRFPEATAQLQAVLTEAEVHYNLASVLEFQGHKHEAKSEYQKSLQLDPDLKDAKTRLAALGND